jgi:hypothetical protein
MIEIRRALFQVEDIFHEFGPPAPTPLRRGFVAAVLANPYAGRHEPDIMPMMDGAATRSGWTWRGGCWPRWRCRGEHIQGYGKGAIVGAAGELEHGALWHVPGGYAMRELLGWKGDAAAYARGIASGQSGNALAIVPSTKKVGPPGAALDVPLTHINASYVRSHFDAMEVRVPGAPRADEIVLVLAMSTGARIHARVGGLAADAIAQWDGQR